MKFYQLMCAELIINILLQFSEKFLPLIQKLFFLKFSIKPYTEYKEVVLKQFNKVKLLYSILKLNIINEFDE